MKIPVLDTNSIKELEDYKTNIERWRYYFDRTATIHIRKEMKRGFPCPVEDKKEYGQGKDGLVFFPQRSAIIPISCTKCLEGLVLYCDCFILDKAWRGRKIKKTWRNWDALKEAERILFWNGHPSWKQISKAVQSMPKGANIPPKPK